MPFLTEEVLFLLKLISSQNSTEPDRKLVECVKKTDESQNLC